MIPITDGYDRPAPRQLKDLFPIRVLCVFLRALRVMGFLRRRMRGMAVIESIIVSDPEIMGGIPCFRGTRVPLNNPAMTW